MISFLCVLLSASLAFAPAPSDVLTTRLILGELADDGALRPSGGILDAGQCRRFQVNQFAAAAAGFTLAAYPSVSLYLPVDHADPDLSGRPVGTCWDMPAAETGSAFVEAARFDYSPERTAEENREAARQFWMQARAGDMVQMLATYSNGARGTHTLLVTRSYNPTTGKLYWADSNFANTRIDGKRYGYVRAYQAWSLEEAVGWLAADVYNGATLYRLRDDIVVREGAVAPALQTDP